MRDLSILIPSRNELFLQETVDCLLANIEADTEIIVVLDGQWPVVSMPDNPRVVLIHHSESIGQRAATNEAARVSQARYVMKLDAHCAVDKGFDRKLIEAAKTLGWACTQVPRMYNLHAFNWKCRACGDETYQDKTPQQCGKCKKAEGFERVMLWQPRLSRMTEYYYFDKDLHFQYWRGPHKPLNGDYIETMGQLGACFFMERSRFFALDGLDERHGSWGQFGTEISCKSWLSGGRQIVNRKTWFAHLFRTQGGDMGFPYPITGEQQQKAREYSNDLWKNNKWPKQVHKLDWLVEKFAPVPTWS